MRPWIWYKYNNNKDSKGENIPNNNCKRFLTFRI